VARSAGRRAAILLQAFLDFVISSLLDS